MLKSSATFLFELIFPIGFFFQILVDQGLQSLHIALGFEDLGIICGSTIVGVIFGFEFRKAPPGGLGKIVSLSHGTLARDGAVGHEGGKIAGEGIGVEAVLFASADDKAVFVKGMGV